MSARPPPVRPPSHSAPTLVRPSSRPGSSPSSPGPRAPAPPSAPHDPLRRVVRNAVAALAIFVGFTALVLVAWFARADAPWGFASFVAFVALLGAAAGGALLWRKPTRQSALAGLGAMAFSILRVGAPDQWTGTSVALLAITILLAVPVIQAAIALPRA